MENNIPYHLTAGIFFDLLLASRKRPAANQKDCFRDLLMFYDRNTAQVLTGNSLHAIASRFRNCDPELAGSDYIHFGDPLMVDSFRERIRRSYDAVEDEMKAYADRYLDLQTNGKWLVRSLLEIVEEDVTIPDDEVIFVNGGSVKKRDLRMLRRIQVYSFLLGVWEMVCSRRYEADRDEYLALTEGSGENRPRQLKKDRIGNTGHPDLSIVFWVDPEGGNEPGSGDEADAAGQECKASDQVDVGRFQRYLQRARQRHFMKKTYIYATKRVFRDFFVCNDVVMRNVDSNGNLVEKHVRGICLSKLPEGTHFIILSGQGGIGKTMMMIHFLLDAIEKSSVNGMIPVYVVLRHYEVERESLLEFVLSELRRHDPSLGMSDLIQLLQSGRAILLMDGLDEIRKDRRGAFHRQLDIMTDQYPDNLFVLSSRLSVDFRMFSLFTVYDLLPLTVDQSTELITRLDLGKENKAVQEDFVEYWHFLEGRRCLTLEPGILLGNPLLLNILFQVYDEERQFPTRGLRFYEEANDALAKKHDDHKGLNRPFETGFSSREFMRYFGEFCMNSYVRGKDRFSFEEVMRGLGSVIERNGLQTSPEAFLDDITEKMCLMIHVDREYMFDLSFFHEYYAAYYCARIFEENPESVRDMLMERDQLDPEPNMLGILYEMDPVRTEQFVFVPFLEEVLGEPEETGGYRRFLERIYPAICFDMGKQEVASGIYALIAEEYELQQEVYGDAFDSVDDAVKKKYLLTKKKYCTGRIRVNDEDEDEPVYEPVYRSMEEMMEEMAAHGLDFEPIYEVRAVDVYQNREACREVIRILEEEEFPLKQEYRLACKLLDQLRAKHAKKEPAEDILARFH